MTMDQELGKYAYCGYASHTKWKSLATGDDLPEWEDLPQPIRDAWNAAAVAVRERIRRKMRDEDH